MDVKQLRRRWLNVAVGAVVLMAMGVLFSWSIFVEPLESDTGWQRSETSVIFTVSMLTFVLGSFFSGMLTSKVGFKVTLLIAVPMMTAGFAAASFADSVAAVSLFYGVLCGVAAGMAYNGVVAAVTPWFPDRRGLVSGILLCSFGLSGVLLSAPLSMLLAALGWRTTFLILAAASFAVLLFGALLMKKAPEGISTGESSKGNSALRDYTAGEMLRCKYFWLFVVCFLCTDVASMSIVGNTAPIASDVALASGYGPAEAVTFSTVVATAFSFANGCGRLMCGFSWDRLGQRITILLGPCCNLAGMALLALAYRQGSVPMVVAGMMITAFAFGCQCTICSSMAADFFGMKYYALNFSIIYMVATLSTLAGPYITGRLHVAAGGSYMTALVVLLVCGVVSVVFAALVRNPQKIAK